MLELKKIYHNFEENIIINNLSYLFEDNSINTIIAPNGTGKTTLLNIISGLLIPNDGEVIFDEGYSEKDVSLLLSGDANLYRKNTVKENSEFFGVLMGLSKEEIRHNIEKYEKMFPIYRQIKNVLVEKLSYGQKRLAALFSAVISESKYILIDEVSEGLDLENVKMLKEFLKEIKKDKVIILVSHDYKFVSDVSDKVLFLADGDFKIVFDKPTEDQIIAAYVEMYMRSK